MTRVALAGVVAVLALAAGGCPPMLSAQSAAPPGRAARLDEVTGFWGNVKSYRLELSQGVALAVTCAGSGPGGPCERLAATSDDPAIAEVRPASLGTLERSGLANQASAAAVVVVGKAPGRTRVRVRSKAGGREITVTVVPAPAAAAPALVVGRD